MKSILAVDDSEVIRNLISHVFCKMSDHYDMSVTECGTDALRLIEQRRSSALRPFDLVLVDVNMPLDINGYETVKEIRKTPGYLTTPILFLTADDSDEAKQRGREVNANGWITKPFAPGTLLKTINRVLA